MQLDQKHPLSMGQLLLRQDVPQSFTVMPSRYLPVGSVGGSMAPRWPILQCLQLTLCLSIWVENTRVWPTTMWRKITAQPPRCSQSLVRQPWVWVWLFHYMSCDCITDQILISTVFCVHRSYRISGDQKQHSSNKLWKLHPHLWSHWALRQDLLDEGQHARQHEHLHSWSNNVLPHWKQHAALHSSDNVQWRDIPLCRHQSGWCTCKPPIHAPGELWVL